MAISTCQTLTEKKKVVLTPPWPWGGKYVGHYLKLRLFWFQLAPGTSGLIFLYHGRIGSGNRVHQTLKRLSLSRVPPSTEYPVSICANTIQSREFSCQESGTWQICYSRCGKALARTCNPVFEFLFYPCLLWQDNLIGRNSSRYLRQRSTSIPSLRKTWLILS